MMTTLRALYPRAAWRPSSDHVNGFAVFAHVVPVEAAESVRCGRWHITRCVMAGRARYFVDWWETQRSGEDVEAVIREPDPIEITVPTGR